LDRRQPRRGRWRAPRQSRGPLPPLSLPHDHELHTHLPQEPEPRQGHRRDQEADGRAPLRRRLRSPSLAYAVDAALLSSLSRALKRERESTPRERRRRGEGDPSPVLAKPSPSPSLARWVPSLSHFKARERGRKADRIAASYPLAPARGRGQG